MGSKFFPVHMGEVFLTVPDGENVDSRKLLILNAKALLECKVARSLY